MIRRRTLIIAGAALVVVVVGLVLVFQGSDEQASTQAVVLNVPPPASEPQQPETSAASEPSADVARVEQTDETLREPSETPVFVSLEESASLPEEPSVTEQPPEEQPPHEQASAEHTEDATAEQVAAADAVQDDADQPQSESETIENAALSNDAPSAAPETQDQAPLADGSFADVDEKALETGDDLVLNTELVVKRGVNLRSKPSTASVVLAFVPVGERLQRQSQDVEQGYYRVAWGEREGWVWQRNVADAEPLPNPIDSELSGVETEEVAAERSQGESDPIAVAAETPDAPVEASEPQPDNSTAAAEKEPDPQPETDLATTSATSEPDEPATSEVTTEGQPNNNEMSDVALAQGAQQKPEDNGNAGGAVSAIVTMNVNMRAEPSKESRILMTLRQGKEVQQLEDEPVQGYFLVEFGDVKGWVWRRAIEPSASQDTSQGSASAQ